MVHKSRELSFSSGLGALSLPTMKKMRLRGDQITTFTFLNQFDDNEREKLFVRYNGRKTIGHNKELGKKLIKKDVKRYFFSISNYPDETEYLQYTLVQKAV